MQGNSISVVVVGAGVVGCASAYYLAKADCSVEVVDRGPIGGEASWASAGMVSQPIPGDDALSCLHEAGARIFPDLAAEISERAGVDATFRMNGGFRLCAEAADLPEWEERYRDLRAMDVPCEWLGPGETVSREPALSPRIAGGIFFPHDGQVDPRRYTQALALAAASYGAQFHTERPVIGFIREGDRVTGVRTSMGPIHADVTVVATGAWSEAIGETLGVSIPMQPVRGQILQLQAAPPILRHTVHCGDFYLTARTDGTILVGSTVEFAGFEKRVTPSGVEHLLDQALRVAPGLADVPLTASWAGLRPYPMRELPILGPPPGLEGIFVAAGHFRTGISPSPITGKLVMEWVTGQGTTLPLEPFEF